MVLTNNEVLGAGTNADSRVGYFLVLRKIFDAELGLCYQLAETVSF